MYDIYWVFLSQRLFGRNVMGDAASRQATNPARLAAEAAGLPGAAHIARQLALPMKLAFRASLFSSDPGEPEVVLGAPVGGGGGSGS